MSGKRSFEGQKSWLRHMHWKNRNSVTSEELSKQSHSFDEHVRNCQLSFNFTTYILHRNALRGRTQSFPAPCCVILHGVNGAIFMLFDYCKRLLAPNKTLVHPGISVYIQSIGSRHKIHASATTFYRLNSQVSLHHLYCNWPSLLIHKLTKLLTQRVVAWRKNPKKLGLIN